MDTATEALSSGIKTRQHIDEDPFGYLVEWIEWDSDFRNSELQHADIILAVNEKKYLKENREQEQSKAIGNYLESTYWTEQDIRDGQSIVLEVFRDGKSLNITGKIQQQQTYLNADNRLTIGVNGPTRLSNDGFASAWINWYEKFVAYTRHYIDDKRWERSTIDNRRLLAEYYEWRERIGYLLIHYPGRFANTVLADWEKVRQIFEGVTYTDITEEDL